MRPIDADKLLRDIEQYHLSDGCFQHWVEVQPTIEGRKKGKWFEKRDTRFGPKLNYIIICSNCNIAFSGEDMIRRSFCPNCGADMRDENDNIPMEYFENGGI